MRVDSFKLFSQRSRLGRVFGTRQLLYGRLQIFHHLWDNSGMLAMESEDLVQEVMAFLETGVIDQLPTSYQCVEQAAEALGDFDADPAWIFAGSDPKFGTRAAMVVAGNEVISDLQKSGAQPAIGTPDERTIG